MSIELVEWEVGAANAADELCLRLSNMEFEGLKLDLVDAEVANGTNSLDVAFLERLENGEHLTESFLDGI